MRTLLLALALLVPSVLQARVVRVLVESRTVIAGGARFGMAGAYERLTGRVLFALDPANPRNAGIVDLALAPRNEHGEVEAWSEFVALRPVDRRRGTVALIDVVNRGGATYGVFHLNARGGSPDSAAAYGDALLLRRGMVIVSLGWQWDVAPGGTRLHFGAPPVRGTNGAITGLVRADFTADSPARAFPLGHALGAGHVPYPVADVDDPATVLTVRDLPTGPRTVIPRARWRFAADAEGSEGAARWVFVPEGLEVGRIYEVVYRATDPVVVGAGLAAVRDLASWLKHGGTDAPRDSAHLAPAVQHVIAYGVSQTGRFLRHFLYENLNTDEAGRQALDGIFAHTAGAGRGSFNHRFAQPSRDAQPFSTFFYPTDVFPFSSSMTTDVVTNRRGGLLARADTAHLPKIFYVDGGYEYWGRGASLAHTTPDGLRDVGFGPRERRYVIAGAQHSSPAPWPLPAAMAPADSALLPIWRGNPLDQRLALRALMVALVYWVRDDIPPPASAYPTIAARQLVPARAARVPRLPGVMRPAAPTPVVRLDLGPDWARGIAAEPPRVGAPYATLVPQVDSLGNDQGGIRSVELLVPLATYFPWQLRSAPPRDRMVSFRGTFVPLAPTDAERARRGDPRPSVERLYRDRDDFLARVDMAASSLVKDRVMLPEDVPVARARMERVWEFVKGRD
ncbi:MAG TPA: alpha/beta hydrolase domain-containing protein [Gemmatimonadaceae bacterium]|nr:alpha/beta hydrolase domain-containing protein [Gemmatimonadaceae bacterium]